MEGEIPKDLSCTYLQVGPGLMEVHGQPVNDPYDADGLVCSVAFQSGRAFFRNK